MPFGWILCKHHTVPPYGVLYFDPEVETRPVRTCYIFVLTTVIP